MKKQWFRLYAEFAFDPKIQSMSETFQRRFVMLLCFKCNDDLGKLTDDEMAFSMRINKSELQKTKAELIKKGFVDKDWNIIAWEKRQYISDSSTDRVRKFRQKKQGETFQNCYGNEDETPPEPETETETETENNFDIFWHHYPKKRAKERARKAWGKIKVTDDLLFLILQAIQAEIKTYNWQKDNGAFIPLPATWLNDKRWEDDFNPDDGLPTLHPKTHAQAQSHEARTRAEEFLRLDMAEQQKKIEGRGSSGKSID